MSNAEASSLPRGVIAGRPGVVRLQRAIASLVVVVPFLGVVAASVMLWNSGVGWLDLVCLALMYLVCMLGITVGFHRYYAHRSFVAGRGVAFLLGIFGSMAVQGPLLFWVATHRRHHAYSDRHGDPHSPNQHGTGIKGSLLGFWHSHIGWMFSPELTDISFFSRDALKNRDAFWIHRTYLVWVALGLLLPAACMGAITGSARGAFQGFLWGGLVRIFLVNHSAWCVGSISHMFGTRPYLTNDHSANNYLVAVLAFGEGLQNNHHAFPGSASHALTWWQPDLSILVIRLLERVGLVRDVQFPSHHAIVNRRHDASSVCPVTDLTNQNFG
jgi:stearoyl-CoA desaturase (delta-9 desaturase)